MLTREKVIIVTVLFFALIVSPVKGGIALFEGNVELRPFEEKKLCGLLIYSTIPGPERAFFKIDYTEELKKFVVEISPNEFYLSEINCTGSGTEKRACIQAECKNPESESCRVVCTTFRGPFELEWKPERKEYRGAVRNIIRISATELVEVAPFNVYYTPFDLKIFLCMISVVVVVVTLITLFILKKIRRK